MGSADIARVAALVGDPTRAAILDALLDGATHPAGELARRAGVAPSTASGHLSLLRDGHLVVCAVHGREHRYRLASAQVAEALEALARVAPTVEIRSLRSANRHAAMRTARTCYDHLAGQLGVGMTDALVRHGALVAHGAGYEVTATGEELLHRLGVDVAAARARRRALTRACIDWTERRPHLAGALGSALASAVIANGWVLRRRNDRALTVTATGAAAMLRELDVRLEPVAA
jgi:DNA-binding transcriptional ArsR family regulator